MGVSCKDCAVQVHFNCCSMHRGLAYLVGGLGRVLLDASLVASVDSETQDVTGVLQGAATKQHLIHGHRHCPGLCLTCMTHARTDWRDPDTCTDCLEGPHSIHQLTGGEQSVVSTSPKVALSNLGVWATQSNVSRQVHKCRPEE